MIKDAAQNPDSIGDGRIGPVFHCRIEREQGEVIDALMPDRKYPAHQLPTDRDRVESRWYRGRPRSPAGPAGRISPSTTRRISSCMAANITWLRLVDVVFASGFIRILRTAQRLEVRGLQEAVKVHDRNQHFTPRSRKLAAFFLSN